MPKQRVQTERERLTEAFFLRIQKQFIGSVAWAETYRTALKEAREDAKREGCKQAVPDIVARKFVRHVCAVIIDDRWLSAGDLIDGPPAKIAVCAWAKIHRRELLRAIPFADFEAAYNDLFA